MENTENTEQKNTELTKLEIMSLSILNGLISNSNWTSYRQIDTEEITTRSVELAKLLMIKIDQI